MIICIEKIFSIDIYIYNSIIYDYHIDCITINVLLLYIFLFNDFYEIN